MNQGHTFRSSDAFHAKPSRTRVAAIVTISLVLGAGAGFASAQVGGNAQRESLLAAAHAQATVADAQRDLAQAAVKEAEENVRSGMASFDVQYQASAALAAAECRRKVLALDIEEISATGGAPRDDLNAPVVNGRDFVRLRIEATMVGTQSRLRTAESIQRMVEAKVRSGGASALTGAAAARDAATVRADLATMAQKLALRAEFLRMP